MRGLFWQQCLGVYTHSSEGQRLQGEEESVREMVVEIDRDRGRNKEKRDEETKRETERQGDGERDRERE